MPEPGVAERSWRSARAGDGSVLGRFVFDPATPNPDTDTDADADADAGEGPVAPYTDAGPGSPGPESWFVPHGFTPDRRSLPQWATEAYLCDCVLHRMLCSESSVLDIGRSTRTVPLPLWRVHPRRTHPHLETTRPHNHPSRLNQDCTTGAEAAVIWPADGPRCAGTPSCPRCHARRASR